MAGELTLQGQAPAEAKATRLSQRDLLTQAKQITHVYDQIPTTVSGSLIAALVLALALWGKVEPVLIFAWGGAVALFQGWRLSRYLRYRRRAHTPELIPQLAREYTIGAAVSGVIWGSVGISLGFAHYETYETAVYIILFGMSMASVGVISSHAPAFFAYVVPTMLPAILVTLARGQPSDYGTAAVGLLFMLVTLRFGWTLNRRFVEVLDVGYENADLVHELRQQKRAAETARDEAQEANRQKSALVEELIAQTAAAEQARGEAEAANIQKSHLVEELIKQKAAAELAREAAENASRARARFLASASHDLRQPLHALGLLVGALVEKIYYPEVRRIVDNMQSSVRALDELFNALLDISKLDAGVVQPKLGSVAMAGLLDRVKADFGPACAEKSLRFVVRACAETVYSDTILLQLILRNLVSNAVRHTKHGGVLVAARRRGERLRIEVWDTGPGIPEAERERIFDEFYQLENPERDRTKGLGLGLAIVRRLVSLLGYRLEVRSRLGRGSLFALEIPLSQSDTPFAEESPPLRRFFTLEGTRIVVVDDEGAIRESMEVLLSQWGCEVITAGSAQEAAERVSETALPDLIIADYRLRENATGTEAIELLHAKCRHDVPAILITGDTGPDRLREAQSSGYRLLHKPVSPARLRAAIHAAIKHTSSLANECD